MPPVEMLMNDDEDNETGGRRAKRRNKSPDGLSLSGQLPGLS